MQTYCKLSSPLFQFYTYAKLLEKALIFSLKCANHTCPHWQESARGQHAGNAASARPHLLVLISGHSDELGLREAVAGDHALGTPNSHDVDSGLILMQGVQHNLRET